MNIIKTVKSNQSVGIIGLRVLAQAKIIKKIGDFILAF